MIHEEDCVEIERKYHRCEPRGSSFLKVCRFSKVSLLFGLFFGLGKQLSRSNDVTESSESHTPTVQKRYIKGRSMKRDSNSLFELLHSVFIPFRICSNAKHFNPNHFPQPKQFLVSKHKHAPSFGTRFTISQACVDLSLKDYSKILHHRCELQECRNLQ